RRIRSERPLRAARPAEALHTDALREAARSGHRERPQGPRHCGAPLLARLSTTLERERGLAAHAGRELGARAGDDDRVHAERDARAAIVAAGRGQRAQRLEVAPPAVLVGRRDLATRAALDEPEARRAE